jgi:hypothetical protein
LEPLFHFGTGSIVSAAVGFDDVGVSFDCAFDGAFAGGLELEAVEEVGAAAAEEAGSFRRALNVEMNSMTAGESPRRLLKCVTASGLDRVEA